jgi:AcrR family transcriptional regulator
MPKAMSVSERRIIKEKLKAAALECFSLYGAKKTTVDELVRRVNIPKGTFYLFYDSKELLFFDLFMDYHEKMQRKLIDKAASLSSPLDIEELTDMFLNLYRESMDSFLFKLSITGELEYIIRKLPPEVTEAHLKQDDDSITEFIRMVPEVDQSQARIFGASFRAIFLTILSKKEIGEDVYDETLRLLVKGVVMQMVKK